MISIKPQFDQLLLSQQGKGKSVWGAVTPANGSNFTSDIVTFIITQGLICRASDIHIEPRHAFTVIRFRIDGKLHEVLSIEKVENLNIISRIKILANIPTDTVSARKAWDGRFSMEISGQKFDFRVATFPTILGDKVAIRIIISDSKISELKKIGLSNLDYARLDRIIQRKSGLVIVSGPTGGGKTTTLYSILKHLHTPSVNIVTLEDPVEYQIDGINQWDLKSRGKDNEEFIDGLKAILRQDPDIILFGEIRDAESAEIAVRASITGHLAFTSLHANSALGTIMRLMNMGVERHVVSYALIGSIAQRLVRKICDNCKVPYKLEPQIFNRICSQCGLNPKLFTSVPKPTTSSSSIAYQSNDDDKSETFTFFKGTGCDQCNGTGYRGRVGIFEVLQVSEEMREAIINKATFKEMENIATKEGHQPLVVDAINKVKAGQVSLDDIYPILLEKSS